MKYITSITCITHNNSIDTEIYEMETTNHKLLFKLKNSYSKYETVITKTEKSLTVELHRLIDELTNNSFIANDLTITHSIILQILITN